MVSQKFFEESTVIIFSAFIASLISYFIDVFPQQSSRIAIILGLFSCLFVVLTFSHKSLSNALWKLSMKRKLRKPRVGIIKQEGCPSPFTSYTPEDWKRRLTDLSLKCEFIHVSEISNKFATIINPYGEEYPEEDLLTLKTLERIKEYISDGGIFLCAGGLAFWYGFDFRMGREVPLAGEPTVYFPHPTIQGGLIPQQTYPPTYSLLDTPLKNNFGVVTTWRNTERDQCFQLGTDRNFVGDIANIGEIAEVLHFRAIREPIKRCIPFLRVTPHNWRGDVYPIAGVPYGKGCLVLCGMNLTADPTNPQWNQKIHQANFEKICHALSNLLRYRREGNIPLSAEQW